MSKTYWEQLSKTKLAIYAVLTAIIVLAQETVAQGLVIVTGLYVAWRAIKLISHSLHCPSCQMKLAGAVLLFFGAVFMAGPHMLMLLVLVLWADALLIDKNDSRGTGAYYG